MKNDSSHVRTMVWDPLVRSFHWLLAFSIITAYFVADEWFYIHLAAGYGILFLLCVRIVWGFFGSVHARFSDFTFGISDVLRHLRLLVRLRTERHLGHNPAGSAMICWLLACLILLVTSGMAIYALEDGAGPLAPLLAEVDDPWLEQLFERTHSLIIDLIVLSVCAHIAGVFIESVLLRENLVSSMITGWKKIVPDNLQTGVSHEK